MPGLTRRPSSLPPPHPPTPRSRRLRSSVHLPATLTDRRWIRRQALANSAVETCITLLSSFDTAVRREAANTLAMLCFSEMAKMSAINGGAVPTLVELMKDREVLNLDTASQTRLPKARVRFGDIVGDVVQHPHARHSRGPLVSAPSAHPWARTAPACPRGLGPRGVGGGRRVARGGPRRERDDESARFPLLSRR